MEIQIKKVFSYQVIRFLLVGCLNTIVGYSFFAFFIWLNLHFAIASILAQMCGVIFNYFSTGKLVFSSFRKDTFIRFVIQYIVSYIMSVILLKILIDLEINAYQAGALILVPMAAMNYMIMKNWVFK